MSGRFSSTALNISYKKEVNYMDILNVVYLLSFKSSAGCLTKSGGLLERILKILVIR